MSQHSVEVVVRFLLAIRVRARGDLAELAEQYYVDTSAAREFRTLLRALGPSWSLVLGAGPRWSNGGSLVQDIDPGARHQIQQLEARVRGLETRYADPPNLKAVVDAAISFLTLIGVRRDSSGDPSLPVQLRPEDPDETTAYAEALVDLYEAVPELLSGLRLDEDETPSEPEK